MIELKGAGLIFQKNTSLERIALKDINLTLQPGDFVSVIGGNGAGKSSLMNAIAGNILLSEGRILIDNHDVSKLWAEQRASEIARVFQDPLQGSFDSLSVAENLALALKRGAGRLLRKAFTSSDLAKFETRLKLLGNGLYKRLDVPISSLSGGQRQAISLLMATITDSKILLLDEHTAALDPAMAKLIMNLTSQIIAEQKLTALMITHSMHDALNFGNRLIIMREGRIQFDYNQSEKSRLTPAELIEIIEG